MIDDKSATGGVAPSAKAYQTDILPEAPNDPTIRFVICYLSFVISFEPQLEGQTVQFSSRQKVSGQIATVPVKVWSAPFVCLVAIRWKNEQPESFPE